MKLLSSNGEIPGQDCLPASLVKCQIPGAVLSYYYTESKNQFILQKLVAQDYDLYFIDTIAAHEETIFLLKNMESLELIICLKDALEKDKMIFHERGMNLFYTPSSLKSITVRKDKICSYLSLHIPKSNLQQITPRNTALNRFTNKVAHNEPALLSTFNHIASSDMLNSISELKSITDKEKLFDAITVLASQCINAITSGGNVQQTLDHTEADIVYAIKSFMEGNPGSGITINDIAAAYKLSPYKINDMFKSLFGITAFNLWLEIRMIKAAELLTTTNYIMSAIAMQVGYSDAANFNRAFTNYYNISPDTYRHKFKK